MELVERVPQVGRLEWIGLSSARRAAIRSVREAFAEPGTGLTGDHHASNGGRRQVTLVQHEHLAVIASFLERDEVSPELLRRNLAISGINLVSLRNRRFRIGEVELEGTGDCPPCTRMEENLGEGGLQAMRGHGGITAVVLRGGALRVGDEVRALPSDGRDGARTGNADERSL